MPLQAIALLALRSLLALALAGAVFALGNWAGGALGDRLPLPGGARLAWDLAWVFVAGIVAASAVAKAAPRAPRLHVLAWCLLLMGVGACAVLRMGEDWPWWFRAGIVAGTPLQGWLGARLASRQAGNAPRVPRIPPEGA